MHMAVSPQKGDNREVRGWDGIHLAQVSSPNMLMWLVLSLGLRFGKRRFEMRKPIIKNAIIGAIFELGGPRG